ncbi:MAG: hypothetical protein WB564_02865 [Dehalococcoidia bacterium]
MADGGNSRGGLLTAGGILSIVVGAFEVIGGVLMVVLAIGTRILFRLGLLPFRLRVWLGHIIPVIPTWLIIVALIVLGILAIVGGVSAIRRKNLSLSLIGAISALCSGILVILAGIFLVGGMPRLLAIYAVPSSILVILGILAVIFVSLSKKEFETEN